MKEIIPLILLRLSYQMMMLIRVILSLLYLSYFFLGINTSREVDKGTCLGFCLGLPKTHNYEPSDAEIRTQIEYQGWIYVVSWIKPDEYFKVYEFYQRGMTLLESADVNKYG